MKSQEMIEEMSKKFFYIKGFKPSFYINVKGSFGLRQVRFLTLSQKGGRKDFNQSRKESQFQAQSLRKASHEDN